MAFIPPRPERIALITHYINNSS